MDRIAYRKLAMEGITTFFILLFTYVAVRKMINSEDYLLQLGRFPFIAELAGIFIWLLPIIHISAALMLSVRRFRKIALNLTLILLLLYTIYIVAVLNFADSVPCSCGAIHPALSWNEHLLFNITCMILAALGIHLSNLSRNHGSYHYNTEIKT